jgi:methylenetetrahydrofolate dehydrogenase (NADP+)/methenyltetrahydrofolate cyclohydrolase
VEKIIDGKAIAARMRQDIAAEVAQLKAVGVTPGLAVVLVGDDPASRVYVSMKEKACAEAGIYSDEHKLPAETSEAQLLALIDELNRSCRCRNISTRARCSSRFLRPRMPTAFIPITSAVW